MQLHLHVIVNPNISMNVLSLTADFQLALALVSRTGCNFWDILHSETAI